jgi:beta-galactosidase
MMIYIKLTFYCTKIFKYSLLFTLLLISCKEKIASQIVLQERTNSFNNDWKLFTGEITGAAENNFDDSQWRQLNLPHDGSIEGAFSKTNPSGADGGYLPTGTGYYRKTFFLPQDKKDNCFFIEFDGIYRNSEVWINNHYLGKRPNGYISFRYDLTEFLNFENKKNILLVKVDNQAQPNARWYTGSGIYRNVWLTVTNKINISQWGVAITAAKIKRRSASLNISTNINNISDVSKNLEVKNIVFDADNRQVAEKKSLVKLNTTSQKNDQEIVVNDPNLWSVDEPYLYTIVTQVIENNKIIDEFKTRYGIRSFTFDNLTGFVLNGKSLKIKGICNHSDLGCLGAAINKSAIKRQLKILKEMGCNGIRTAHNPPAPELLDLCDEMGFIVMDEAFDVWKTAKTYFDYHWNWDEWHKRDLEDQVKRDRNHPCVFIWSIGNEIPEQLGEGGMIANELRNIIRAIDTSRPITAGNNLPYKNNTIIQSGALDIVGCNYHNDEWYGFPSYYPGQSFIGTETVSGLQTRGEYSFPSDKVVRWGDPQSPVFKNPADNTCSAYDQEFAYWGSTHEVTLKTFKQHDFVSGMFVWSGFDYLGEPTPYAWPSRSSYYGIIDLAGFPKDVYYLYQSEWTDKPVLHLFPHWNWKENELVDVWVYYNNADEAELYLNGNSLGVKKKINGNLHVMWRIPFNAGTLKVVSRKNGKTVLVKEIKTAGAAVAIVLSADKEKLNLKENELAFITAKIVDASGNIIPDAANSVSFEIKGSAFIAGVDNGNPVSHEPFKASNIKAFHGLALAVIQPQKNTGSITITAKCEGLKSGLFTINSY